MGTASFPGVKSGRGVRLTTHPLLVPWSRKSRAILLPPYGPYGLYRASVPVQGCTWVLYYLNRVCPHLSRVCVSLIYYSDLSMWITYLILHSNTCILSGFTYLFNLDREICFMLYYVSRALLRFPVRPHPVDRFRNTLYRVMLDSATFGAQLHFAHSSQNCKVLLYRFPRWLTCGERRTILGRQGDTSGSAFKEFSKNVLCKVW